MTVQCKTQVFLSGVVVCCPVLTLHNPYWLFMTTYSIYLQLYSFDYRLSLAPPNHGDKGPTEYRYTNLTFCSPCIMAIDNNHQPTTALIVIIITL
jgi:hypothetical protein